MLYAANILDHSPLPQPSGAQPTSGSGLLLGIDTGGTFTDAIIYNERTGIVVAKAKAVTSHRDLAIGIRSAVGSVLDQLDDAGPADLDLVCLSTTLATNALVENKGCPTGLIVVGFDEAALQRAGLAEALEPGDTSVLIAGGHDSHGNERTRLDEASVLAFIADAEVDAFAITAEFSVRNPSHERSVAKLIADHTTKPATTSHQLSARLNGPKRALTTLLNARLISLTDDLLVTADQTLRQQGVTAPLMIVRGDGSLVSADFVRARPIETILSGPAASVIGAAHLTHLSNGIVADIGGTTTDIAVLRNGKPDIDPDGALVGGHHTMVEAVAMRTHGVGGDSHLRLTDPPDGTEFDLGPRRVVPLSQLAIQFPEQVHGALDQQLRKERVPVGAETLLMANTAMGPDQIRSLDPAARTLFDSLGDELHHLSALAGTSAKRRVVDRLVQAGSVLVAGFTPTDASLAAAAASAEPPSTRPQQMDAVAAIKGAELIARQRDRFGQQIAASSEAVTHAGLERLFDASCDLILAAALANDGFDPDLADSPLAAAGLASGRSSAEPSTGAQLEPSTQPPPPAIDLTLRVALPVVALGAPALAYYPTIASRLGTNAVVPEHAEVANAIGAVVGRVRLREQVTISAPRRGSFIVGLGPPVTVYDLDEAKDLAREHLEQRLRQDMQRAGSSQFEITWEWAQRSAEIERKTYFVEGTLTAVGNGRPNGALDPTVDALQP